METIEISEHDKMIKKKPDHTYRITVNDTAVRIRFSGEIGINTSLASALSRTQMTNIST